MLSFRLDVKLTGLGKDITLTFVYVQPYKSAYYDTKNFDCTLSLLEDFLIQSSESYGEVQHMVIGDLNSRIGTWTLKEWDSDEEEELFVSDTVDDTYAKRSTKDLIVNTFGRQLIELANVCKLVPLNGNVAGDKDGNFTFISTQGNSVIDFALVSHEIYNANVCCLHILPRIESSHSPLYVPIYKTTEICKRSYKKTITIYTKYIWKNELSNEFTQNMESEQSAHELKDAENVIDESPNEAVKRLTDIIKKGCM